MHLISNQHGIKSDKYLKQNTSAAVKVTVQSCLSKPKCTSAKHLKGAPAIDAIFGSSLRQPVG